MLKYQVFIQPYRAKMLREDFFELAEWYYQIYSEEF